MQTRNRDYYRNRKRAETPSTKKYIIVFTLLLILPFAKFTATEVVIQPVMNFFTGLTDKTVSLSTGNQNQDLTSQDAIEKDALSVETFSLFNQPPKQEIPPPPENPQKPENALPIITKFYQYSPTAVILNNQGAGLIKNATTRPASEIESVISQPLPFKVEVSSDKPQVLIMHTHSTESYEKFDLGYYNPATSSRSTDENNNMIAVGKAVTAELQKNGINTIHDTTMHDQPYTGAYDKSEITVKNHLKSNPSIKVVIDVHRDAIETGDGSRYKPTAKIGDKNASQMMIIAGTSGKGITLPNPDENLKFASKLQNQLESMYPGLTRPLLYDYRHYNQDLTTGSLLVEVGGHANTIAESVYSGTLLGSAISELFKNQA